MTTQKEQIIIDKIILALETYNLGNIKDSRKINMMLATFIFCSCFIDQMAQIRYFDLKKWKNKTPYLTSHFIRFVGNYFNKKYNPVLLYDSLRSRLVHNYSVKGKYWLTDERKYKNLQHVKGRIYLNIDDFITDIESAWMAFKKELVNNSTIRNHAIDHELIFPILKEGII